jgi:aromatic-amino-acid transaminase
MIEALAPKAPDPLLKIIKMFREDPRSDKIDLGVGVYKDATGNTPVMRAVKDAEARLLATRRRRRMSANKATWIFCDWLANWCLARCRRGVGFDPGGGRHGRAAVGLRSAARERRQARAAAGAVLAKPSLDRARGAHEPIDAPFFNIAEQRIDMDALIGALREA